ncbi:MAG: glycosyltransferase family 4 protein, partial [Gemmatimonadota bacterium]
MNPTPETALFVANYPANTGYAWDFIERLYAGIADHLAGHDIRSLVAYPEVGEYPRTLQGSAAEPVERPIDLSSRAATRELAAFVRAENVRVLYLTDRAFRSLAFPALRRAGVRRIISHDHTSGARTPARGPRRWAKWALARVPGVLADVIVAVSDYVARRHLEVSLVPADRLVRIHNGIEVRQGNSDVPTLRSQLAIEPGAALIACAGRAHPVKGVHHLLRAFDLVITHGGEPRPHLVFAGAGPQMEELEAIRMGLASRDRIHLPGYVPAATARLRDAAMFVVPSIWQDALPLAVMEPMAYGKAVIASRVGGVPEMVEHGATGLL